MRDSDVDLYTFGRLEAEFGTVNEVEANGVTRTAKDMVGVQYRTWLAEMSRIVGYQWREHIERSVLKGFLLHGGVGLGKTTLAKRLAYELCHQFGDVGDVHDGNDEIVLILVDTADLARGLYGDTEEQLKQLFELARSGHSRRHGHSHDGTFHDHAGEPARRTILLFDDVESLFMHRAAATAKEWHFSQNSVFFHQIDALDTAHIAVVLTTNRIDLLDEAIVDRFLPYAFELPPVDVLSGIARSTGHQQRLSDEQLAPVLAAIDEGEIRSVRELERRVMQVYVNVITTGR
jgi:AAA+ superfamily predicted ATPase